MDTPPPDSGGTSGPPSYSPPPVFDDRQWNIALHLSGLAGFVIPTLGNILAPLIIWLIKRQESPLIEAAGREVLNFQISFTIYAFVAGMLMYVLIGFVLAPIIGILWLIFTIIGGVKASKGENYRYPLTIRML